VFGNKRRRASSTWGAPAKGETSFQRRERRGVPERLIRGGGERVLREEIAKRGGGGRRGLLSSTCRGGSTRA